MDSNTRKLLCSLLAFSFCLFSYRSIAQDELEKIFWESVVCSDRAQVEAYLQEYPTGIYIEQARQCLEGGTSNTDSMKLNQLINSMLTECENHLSANRLTSGAGGTALECFNGVLEIDSDNEKALKGLQNIQLRYTYLISSQISDGNLERAERYLEILRSLNPTHPELTRLSKEIASARADTPEEVAEPGTLKVLILPWRRQSTFGHEDDSAIEGTRRAFNQLSDFIPKVGFSRKLADSKDLELWLPDKSEKYWDGYSGTLAGVLGNRRMGEPDLQEVREIGLTHEVDVVLMISMLRTWSNDGSRYGIEAHAVDIHSGRITQANKLILYNATSTDFEDIVLDVFRALN